MVVEKPYVMTAYLGENDLHPPRGVQDEGGAVKSYRCQCPLPGVGGGMKLYRMAFCGFRAAGDRFWALVSDHTEPAADG